MQESDLTGGDCCMCLLNMEQQFHDDMVQQGQSLYMK